MNYLYILLVYTDRRINCFINLFAFILATNYGETYVLNIFVLLDNIVVFNFILTLITGIPN